MNVDLPYIISCEKRNKRYEKHLLKQGKPEVLSCYAQYIIRGRWPEAEEIILTNYEIAHYYTIDVIKGRWLKYELYAKKDYYYSYLYAKDVIKDRWHEVEPIILTSCYYSYLYAKDVIKGRWHKAETIIKENDPSWKLYCNHFNIKKEKCNWKAGL